MLYYIAVTQRTVSALQYTAVIGAYFLYWFVHLCLFLSVSRFGGSTGLEFSRPAFQMLVPLTARRVYLPLLVGQATLSPLLVYEVKALAAMLPMLRLAPLLESSTASVAKI